MPENSSQRNAIWRVCRRTISYCLLLLNCLLLILAIGQSILSLYITLQEEIPVPDFILKKLEENFKSNGTYSVVGSYSLDLNGHINARDLRLFTLKSRELLAQSDFATITLDIPSLFIRRVVWNEFDLSNAHLNCPALYSSTGDTETFAREIYARFARRGKSWTIRQLNLRLHNLRIQASGEFPKIASLERIESPLERYLQFCRRASVWQLVLRTLKNPVASINLDSKEKGATTLEVDLTGEGFRLSRYFRTGPFRFQTSGLRFPQLEMSIPAKIEVSNVYFGESDQTGKLYAEYKTDFLLKNNLRGVEYLRFATRGLEFSGLSVANVIGVLYPNEFPTLAGRLALQMENEPLALHGRIDLANGNGSFSFDSRIPLLELMNNPLLAKYSIGKLIEFPTPPHIKGELKLEDGFSFARFDFDVEASPFALGGSRFDRLKAKGTVDSERMVIGKVIFENPKYRTIGSIESDFTSGKYRLLLSGKLFPTDLDPALPDWWDRIWSKFEFSQEPFVGDYDILIDWRKRQLVCFYGSAEGSNFSYNDLQLTQLSLKSSGVHNRVDLFDIKAKRAEGKGYGSLTWIYKDKRNIQRLLDFETHFYADELSAFLGEGVKKVVENFSLAGPPHLRFSGTLFKENAPPGLKRDILIKASSSKPLRYREIPMDWLEFEGRLTEERFSIDPLSFGFAGGKATGSLSWERAKPVDLLTVRFNLSGADQKRALETIGFAAPSNEEIDASADESKKVQESPGILNLEIEASGNPENYLSFEGSGLLSIVNSELAKVHLFGGFSRLFHGTWIDFSTLNLKSAMGRFTLHRDRLNFSPIMFTGEQSVIQAEGDILFPVQDIDFRVRVFYLENPNNPITTVFSPLFKPLGDALELRLWGTYNDPKWRLLINPRNVSSASEGPLSESTRARNNRN